MAGDAAQMTDAQIVACVERLTEVVDPDCRARIVRRPEGFYRVLRRYPFPIGLAAVESLEGACASETDVHVACLGMLDAPAPERQVYQPARRSEMSDNARRALDDARAHLRRVRGVA